MSVRRRLITVQKVGLNVRTQMVALYVYAMKVTKATVSTVMVCLSLPFLNK